MIAETSIVEIPAPVKPAPRAAVYQRPADESPARKHLRFWAKAMQEGLESYLAETTHSGTIWDVTSSQPRQAPYTVTCDERFETTCTCEAVGYCKHAALVIGVDWKGYDPTCPACHLGECWTFTTPTADLTGGAGAWRCRRCGASADFTADEAATIYRIRHMQRRTDDPIPAEPILLASWQRAQGPPPDVLTCAAVNTIYALRGPGRWLTTLVARARRGDAADHWHYFFAALQAVLGEAGADAWLAAYQGRGN